MGRGETITRLHEGHALNIYPEGSRTDTGELLPIEKGVTLIVRKAKIPIVPAVGSFEAWPKGQRIFHCIRFAFLYGPPLELAGQDREQIVATIDRTFHEMFDRLRSGKIAPDHRER